MQYEVYFDEKKVLNKIYVVAYGFKQDICNPLTTLAITKYFTFSKITYHCLPPVQRSYGLRSHLELF